MTDLRPGIPSVNEFKNVIKFPLYNPIEKYSEEFLQKYMHYLRNRENPKGLNPFHAWSRIWEYPFIASRVLEHFKGKSARILDAGSGLTFFPYYLAKESPGLSVLCCDQTSHWQEPHRDVAAREKLPVEFIAADIRRLELPDHSLDGIYCVSVLEHTNCYEDIIAEFHRVLKPGAPLWVTIDISLDGCTDIPVDQAKVFTKALTKHFKMNNFSLAEFDSSMSTSDFASTVKMAKIDRRYLPWIFPRLSALRTAAKKGKFSLLLDITFACYDLTAL